jgi:hypothetical protein
MNYNPYYLGISIILIYFVDLLSPNICNVFPSYFTVIKKFYPPKLRILTSWIGEDKVLLAYPVAVNAPVWVVNAVWLNDCEVNDFLRPLYILSLIMNG